MKRAIILAGLLLPIFAWSQSPDSANRSLDSNRQSLFLTGAPRLGGISLTDAVTPMKINNGNSMVQQHIVDFGIPLVKDFTSAHPIFIKTGFRYENLIVPDITAFGTGSFNSFTVPFLASYSITKKTNLTLVGMGTLATDMKTSIHANDVQYVAGIRIGFQPNPNLRYGVTMTYVNNYSGQLIIPVPDIDWTINKKWQLTAIVPSRVSLKYKIAPNQSFGLTTGYVASVYGLTQNKEMPNRQYLSWQQFSGGLIYDVTLSKRWNFNLVAGHSFMQRLETFDQATKASFNNFSELSNRKPIYSDRQTSFIFQAGINYKF